MNKVKNIVVLVIVVTLTHCQFTGKFNERKVFKEILKKQRDSEFSQRLFQEYKEIAEAKFAKILRDTNNRKEFIIEALNEGVYHNPSKDSLYFVITYSYYYDPNFILPDSLKKYRNKKALLTQGFPGLIKNDSVIYLTQCGDSFIMDEGELEKQLYNASYREKVLKKIIELIYNEENTNSGNYCFGDADIDYKPMKIFWTTYNQYMDEQKKK